MNTKLQFRVLYRQFLFRLMDVEFLAASARGDASQLFGQLAPPCWVYGQPGLSVMQPSSSAYRLTDPARHSKSG